MLVCSAAPGKWFSFSHLLPGLCNRRNSCKGLIKQCIWDSGFTLHALSRAFADFAVIKGFTNIGTSFIFYLLKFQQILY